MAFSPEVQAILDRVNNGTSQYSPGEQPKPKVSRIKKPKVNKLQGQSQRGANLKGTPRPPKHDYRALANDWSDGMMVKDIAEKHGCNPQTVTSALKKYRPLGYTGKSGRPSRGFCRRDHDMEVHGKWNKADDPSKGKYCSECKRMRERGDL